MTHFAANGSVSGCYHFDDAFRFSTPLPWRAVEPAEVCRTRQVVTSCWLASVDFTDADYCISQMQAACATEWTSRIASRCTGVVVLCHEPFWL